MADGGGDGFPATEEFFQELALGEFHAVNQIVKPLLALADEFHGTGEGAVLREFGQGLAAHQQAVAHGAG